MINVQAKIENDEAGAEADAGQGKATNPHPPQTARARTWDNVYLDRQEFNANRDGDLPRKRATLHLPKIKD